MSNIQSRKSYYKKNISLENLLTIRNGDMDDFFYTSCVKLLEFVRV